jgi:hypothetical protein
MPIIGRPWDDGAHAIEWPGENDGAGGIPWQVDQIAIIFDLLLM